MLLPVTNLDYSVSSFNYIFIKVRDAEQLSSWVHCFSKNCSFWKLHLLAITLNNKHNGVKTSTGTELTVIQVTHAFLSLGVGVGPWTKKASSKGKKVKSKIVSIYIYTYIYVSEDWASLAKLMAWHLIQVWFDIKWIIEINIIEILIKIWSLSYRGMHW